MAAKPLFVPVQPDPLNIAVRSDPKVTQAVFLEGLITQKIRAYSRDGQWAAVVKALRERANNDLGIAQRIDRILKEQAR